MGAFTIADVSRVLDLKVHDGPVTVRQLLPIPGQLTKLPASGAQLAEQRQQMPLFPLETAFKHTLHNFFLHKFFLLSFCCLLTGTIRINLFYHKKFFV